MLSLLPLRVLMISVQLLPRLFQYHFVLNEFVSIHDINELLPYKIFPGPYICYKLADLLL